MMSECESLTVVLPALKVGSPFVQVTPFVAGISLDASGLRGAGGEVGFFLGSISADGESLTPRSIRSFRTRAK